MWSASPKVETLYLGDDVEVLDVWGRSAVVEEVMVDGHPRQQIPVGPMPVFVIGADPMLLAFRMGVHLSTNRLDAILGDKQRFECRDHQPVA